MVQLRAEHALGQLLLELLDKPRFSKHALGVTASHLRRQKEKGPARVLFHYFAIAGLNLLVALVAVLIVRPKRIFIMTIVLSIVTMFFIMPVVMTIVPVVTTIMPVVITVASCRLRCAAAVD